MTEFLTAVIVLLAFLLGITASLLYISLIPPQKREELKMTAEEKSPKAVKEFINFLTYDGREQK